MNTEVGVKEIVHRIFKSIVSHTNCKNVGAGFIDISRNTNRLFKDWFITKRSPELDNREPEESEGNCLLLF